MPKQQIQVELSGGIGNQLFQFAAAYGLSRRLEVELVLDVSWYQRVQRQGPRRRLELEKCVEVGSIPTYSSTHSPHLRQIAWFLTHKLVLRDDDITPEELCTLDTKRNIRMQGYWQNCNYFASIAEQILFSFRGSELTSPSSYEILRDIRNSGALGLHVRRGDYITDPKTRAYHGICDMSYYHRAVDRVLSATQIDRMYVFSDDVEWCEDNIRFDLETVIVRSSIPDTDQLKLMAGCQHHVISNSSFSWWAAWFGQSATQIVVFPEKWFADGTSLDDPPLRWSPM